MKKCVLVSFFNSHNLGDCMIADMLYKKVSEHFITEKYSYSGNPLVFTDINDIGGTNTTNPQKINTSKRSIFKFFERSHLTILIKLYRMLKRKTSATSYADFESKIQDADFLVIGGGNMIFDIDKHSNSASRFNSFIEIAKKRDIKVFVTSIGIGPFTTWQQEKEAVDALRRCDYISFRDQKSYDIFTKHTDNLKDVFISVDPVFFLPYSLKPSISNSLVIGLNIFNSKLIKDSERDYVQLIEGYVKLAEGLTNKIGAKVVMFSTDLSDYETIYDVYNRLSEKQNFEVREINGLDSLIELYSEISILVGTRMHAMIIAYTQHIPVIGLSWQPKVDAFFDIIDSKNCLYNYSVIGASFNEIITTCQRKFNNLNNEKNQIKERLDLIRKKEIDADVLHNIASVGPSRDR
ncbi:polysaccharide pyruvyl transferase family protein [Alkalihalobacterium bogoriense]|uniref:polysaccharide pyruvyl transferase family protein n=1 Tax=Alkalihalobacterium bogoriense TaxID=246272 RepID=UPI000478F0B9|nr:polysaccharide pyruvyl transferase family protein [Alkalihalobacterium bogoriense]